MNLCNATYENGMQHSRKQPLGRQFVLLIFFIAFFLASHSYTMFAETKFTISGYVKDETTGEVLIGVSIYDTTQKAGCRTNNYGFFSLSVPEGRHVLRISYVGYSPKIMDLLLKKNESMTVELTQNTIQTKEVTVSGAREDGNVKSTDMGVAQLSPADVKTIPVIFGEKDILKTIQLLPGIKSTGDASSGFVVRGGSPDQNLILLDEATVYNPSHLLGFFSVFNSDAIKYVKVIKGDDPAQYGGRLASVLDITMNDGNMKSYHANGGIGIISSGLTAEGPIVENKASFIISGRRTYADLFLPLSNDENVKNSALYFYDLNAKVNYKVGDNDRLYLSGYLGRDAFRYNDKYGLNWGNQTLTFRWNHLFNEKLFSNSSLIYSNYDYLVNIQNGQSLVDVISSIKDYSLKEDFQYLINTDNSLFFGLNVINHTFIPGKLSSANDSTAYNNVTEKYAWEFALYLSHEYSLLENLKVNYGLRYSGFALTGPGTFYTFDNNGALTNAQQLSNSKIVKMYGGFEPRLSLNYLLDDNNSVKLSYTRNMQYLHLLSNTTASSQLDIWQPSTNNIKPGIADQISLGYYRNFDNNSWEASVEVYYKYLQNQIDYKNGADLIANNQVESQLEFGKGTAYGAELYIKKSIGDFTGWISYSLSKSTRQFNAIDDGRPFPDKYDHLHDISIVCSYQMNEKWNFSADWVFNTGDAITYPGGKYTINGQVVNLYSDRNSSRMPDYHRLDLSATYYFEKKGSYSSNLNFSIYNAYGNKNAYSIKFQKSDSDPARTDAVMTYLFTFVPSITYNFNF